MCHHSSFKYLFYDLNQSFPCKVGNYSFCLTYITHVQSYSPRNHQENYYLSKIVADLDWTAIEENSSRLLLGSSPLVPEQTYLDTLRQEPDARQLGNVMLLIGKLTKLRT